MILSSQTAWLSVNSPSF